MLGFLMSNPVNSVEFPGQKLLPYSLGILQICVVLTLQQVTTSENQLKKSVPLTDNIDRPLLYIISKATEKNPDKRYQTVLEFKDALMAYVNGEDKKPFPMKETIAIIAGVVLILVALAFIMLMK